MSTRFCEKCGWDSYENMTQVNNRSTVLDDLGEILNVVRSIEEYAKKLAELEDEIEKITKEAESESKKLTVHGKRIVKISCIVAAFIGFLMWEFIGAVFMVAIVGWLSFCIVDYNESKKYATERLQKKEAYEDEFLVPKQQLFERLAIEVNDFANSDKVRWAEDVVGSEFFSVDRVETLYNFISSKRADSIKEAINLYDVHQHQQKMENMQTEVLLLNRNMSKEMQNQTKEIYNQSKNLREIGKNTKSASRMNKVNVLINYKIYKNTNKK